MLHLYLHHQCQRYHEHSQRILYDYEHLAEHHLALSAQCALDHVDGLVAGRSPGGHEPAERAQRQYSQHIYDDVARSQHQIQLNPHIHRKGIILGYKQRVHHRDQQVCQQQCHDETNRSKGYRLTDILP